MSAPVVDRESERRRLQFELRIAWLLRDTRMRQRKFTEGGDDVNYYERELERILKRLNELEGH